MKKNSALFALVAAGVVSSVEAVVLAVMLQQQFDARHLAALAPIFLTLYLGLVSTPTRLARASMLLIGGAWLVADLRAGLLQEYQKEDYRDAVAEVIRMHRSTGAAIAVAADPVAASYYGLSIDGDAPCYPLLSDCAVAFQRVPWPRLAEAAAADRWKRADILRWLTFYSSRRVPVALLLQLDRAHRESKWWPILQQLPPSATKRVHGFEIVILRAEELSAALSNPGIRGF
jgi:hypothetical protein